MAISGTVLRSKFSSTYGKNINLVRIGTSVYSIKDDCDTVIKGTWSSENDAQRAFNDIR